METLTINENDNSMLSGTYNTIMEQIQSKEQGKRLIGQDTLREQCSKRDPLFEPYLLKII